MKGNFKKIICGALSLVMIGSLAACGTTEPTLETGKNVVAVWNGQNITREEVGASLEQAESDIIKGYIQEKVVSEFFKDETVTPEEINQELNLVKQQVGEEQWPMYLAYYGGGTEESFKLILESTLREQKYIQKKIDKIKITDEEYEKVYNENPKAHDIAVLDVIFMGDYNDLTKAKELSDSGKSLEEIAVAMEKEVSKDRHTYVESEGLNWDKDLSTAKPGDIFVTDKDSGSYIIGRVNEVNAGKDNPTVKLDMLNELKYNKAMEETNTEIEKFIKEQKIQIFGKDINLYEEEPSEGDLSEFGNPEITITQNDSEDESTEDGGSVEATDSSEVETAE